MKKIWLLVVLILLLSACSNTRTVSVTYEPNGGTVLSLTASVNSNSPQWYPLIPQKMNYLFVNWYLDQDLTVLFTSDALLENDTITLYAKYMEVDQDDFFLVEFVSMGGTFTPNQMIASGGLLTEPAAPTKENYTFLRWEYSNSLSGKTGPVNFLEPITENLGLQAVWASGFTKG